jgi:hypothetical protein
MVRPTTTVPSAAGLILKLVHMRSLYDAAAPVLQPSPPQKRSFAIEKRNLQRALVEQLLLLLLLLLLLNDVGSRNRCHAARF